MKQPDSWWAPCLAIDTETRGLDWWLPEHHAFLASWSTADRDAVAALPNAARDPRWAELQPLLNAAGVLLFANASFDIHMLRASAGIDLLARDELVIHDVQTLARVVMPERGYKGYKLKDLGVALLSADAKAEQDELKRLCKELGIRTLKSTGAYYALWRAFPEQLEAYAMKDTRMTWDLWTNLLARSSQTDRNVYEFEMAVAPLLRRAEARGIKTDIGRAAVLRARLEGDQEELHGEISQWFTAKALGDDGEPANRAELLQCILDLGVPLYRRTKKTNQIALDADALREFEDRFPQLGSYMEWRKLGKVLATYVPAMERGHIHTSISQCAARTSRMSSSRPNMQNLPRNDKKLQPEQQVRGVFVPAPGNAFVVVDYDSIEVRVLAHYLKDEGLLYDLANGMDLHSMIAYEARSALGGVSSCRVDYRKDGPEDHIRTLAKTTVFSALYGAGAPLLSRRLGVSMEEASRIRSAVLDAIPNYWDLYDRVAAQRRKTGCLRTITGRRLDVPGNKQHLFVNSIVQGSASEIMKMGLVAAAPVQARFGYQPLLVVHDELLSEGPADQAEACLAATITAMEGAFALRTPLKATGSWSTDSYASAK